MKKFLSLVIIGCLVAVIAIGEPMAGFRVDFGSQAEAAAAKQTGYYKVTPSEGLSLRSGAGTSYTRLKVMPYNTTIKVTKIKGNWGYTSYGGKSGWASLSYAKYLGKYIAGSYKVTAQEGLNLRKGAGTSYSRLCIVPYNKTLKVTKVSGSWGYTTYGGKSGWVSLAYTKMTTGTTTTSTTAVSKPTGVKASTTGAAAVKLTWSKVSGASGYVIYRATDKNGSYTKVKTVSGGTKTSFTNTGLSKNKAYYYKMKAYKGSSSKKYSDYSFIVCGYTGSQGTSLSSAVCSSSGAATLKWSKPTYATGYQLYRAASKTGTYSKVATLSLATTSYKNTGLTNGKTYYYKIRTYRKIGSTNYYSGFSAVKSVKVTSTASKITVTGLTKPSTLKVYQPFSLKGTVKSNYSLKSVKVGVCTSSGAWKSGMYVTKAPYTKSFSIASVDALIIFNNLSKGTYYYKVTATDSKGYTKTVNNSKFTVTSTSTKYIWPCGTRANISQYFESYNWLVGHAGLDIAMPYGTSIKASRAGFVMTSQWNNSYGYYVMILHDDNYITLYAHCSKLLVSAGDTVKQGEVIAKVGSTGNSTGNHLHFEVRDKNGTKVNPLNYLP